jgi:hypothetical protein
MPGCVPGGKVNSKFLLSIFLNAFRIKKDSKEVQSLAFHH